MGLRKVFFEFLRNGPHHLLLGHGAIQSAERSFHFPEVPDFLAEVHIAICDYSIAIVMGVKRNRRENGRIVN
jgi:hypothetical protein